MRGNGRKLRKHEDTAGEKQPGNRQGEAVARRKRGKKRVGAGWRTRREKKRAGAAGRRARETQNWARRVGGRGGYIGRSGDSGG